MPISRIPGVGLETTGTASVNTFLRGDNAWAGTITSGTAVTASGTSVDFTGIPVTARRITVMFSGVSWNNTATPLIQLGDSGGVETTGYTSIGGFTASAGGSAGAGTESTGFGIGSGWTADTAFSGSFIFSLLNASSNTWVEQGVLYADTATTDYAVTSSGVKSLSATLDRVRITSTAAVTFDAGTINIMWEG